MALKNETEKAVAVLYSASIRELTEVSIILQEKYQNSKDESSTAEFYLRKRKAKLETLIQILISMD